MNIRQAVYELEHTQTVLISLLVIIDMKNGCHLEFCKMTILIILSVYQDLPIYLHVKFHENPSSSSQLKSNHKNKILKIY